MINRFISSLNKLNQNQLKMTCRAIKNDGYQCSNRRNILYGDYCGVHKSCYYEKIAESKKNMLEALRKRNEELQQKLATAIEQGKLTEIGEIHKCIIGISKQADRVCNEMLDAMKKQIESVKEEVKLQGEKTRETVVQESNDNKMMQLQTQFGMSQIAAVMMERFDRLERNQTGNKIESSVNQNGNKIEGQTKLQLTWIPTCPITRTPNEYQAIIAYIGSNSEIEIDGDKIIELLNHWKGYDFLKNFENSNDHEQCMQFNAVVQDIAKHVADLVVRKGHPEFVVMIDKYLEMTIKKFTDEPSNKKRKLT